MKFGLEQHIIDNLIAVFEQHSKVDKALVFGSRAKGNYRPDSDIDIAIKGPDLNTDDIIAMSVAFEEKGITHKIDLINYDKINEPDLKDHIDRVGIELYSRWREYKILKLGKVVTGNTPSSKFPEEFGNEMPFVTPTDYKNYNKWIYTADRYLSDKGIAKLKSRVLPANSILVTCIGSDMGKIAINKIPVVTNQQINSIIINEKVNADFLYYKLISSYDILRTYGEAGTAVPIVNKGDFENIEITIPSDLNEQTAIANILSSLDDKIDLLHRQNKTLEQLAETLFRQWFVEEAEESWEEKSFKDLIETSLGGEWGKENPEGDFQLQVQCIRGTDIADLQTGIPLRTPIRFIKQNKFESIEIKDGDLVMEISGGTDNQSTGRTTYINDNVKALFKYPLVFSNFCRLIRPKKKEYSFFIYSYIHHLYEQGDLFNLENGSSGIKNLNYKALLFELAYKLPNEKKIIQFHKDVEQYFYKINKNKFQIRTLTQTRDTLLPKLMSGEVRVKI